MATSMTHPMAELAREALLEGTASMVLTPGDGAGISTVRFQGSLSRGLAGTAKAFFAATFLIVGAPESQVRSVVSSRIDPDPMYQVPYNGSYTFTRVRYGSGRMRSFGRGWSNAWNHDYPAADRNMQVILEAFTSMFPNTSGSNVLDLENPEIFKHPILYMSEPGFWTITAEGAENLRPYLLKGGMLIFDDFEAEQWHNMAAQVARALPEAYWVEIDGSHPVFQSVFIVEDIYVPHPLVAVTPRYMAIFEENDPNGRVMVLANHNSDLAEYWEYSAQGYFPVDPTNDAYRVGVNEIVYGMTR